MNWINKALKRIGIKGEHAYLEGATDMLNHLAKEMKDVDETQASNYFKYLIKQQKIK